MISKTIRLAKLWLSLCLTALLLLFAFVNREFVDISLFPLPYEISLPKFLLALVAFAGGIIVGGCLMSLKLGRAKREYKREHKRVVALENEVKSIHTEQHVLPR